jgi:hypothetical protein
MKTTRPNQTVDESNEIASGWAKLSGPSESSRGLFCFIGMLDGLLVSTKSPALSETNRPNDFRSGHKNVELDCQAVCDSSLRFLFISINKSPGKTNDLKAYYRMSKLSQLIENLPEGYFCGGNNAAYCNSEHLLVPFPPGQNLQQHMDSFNYFLSQLLGCCASSSKMRCSPPCHRLGNSWCPTLRVLVLTGVFKFLFD